MALETGTFISDLVATNPTGSDPLAFADDHLRLVKSTIKATFPNISGAVTKTHAEINALASQSELTALQTTLTAAIATAVADTKNALYPVGSIYTNATSSTNPATLLGFGTWVVFGEGRVLVGQNASDALFDSLEETGGSKDAVVVSHSHTFSGTTSGVGDHQHYPSVNGNTNGYAFGGDTYNVTRASQDGYYQNTPTTPAGAHSHTYSGTTSSTGSSGTNANIQPYVVVKMWKRTA